MKLGWSIVMCGCIEEPGKSGKLKILIWLFHSVQRNCYGKEEPFLNINLKKIVHFFQGMIPGNFGNALRIEIAIRPLLTTS